MDGSRIGVARGVDTALIGKILDDKGRGGTIAMYDAITWAVTEGAQVISMSVGFDFPGQVKRLVAQGLPADIATSRALKAYEDNLRLFDRLLASVRTLEAFGTGCVIVAAAGNESRQDKDPNHEIAVSLPASAKGVLSTGALALAPAGYVAAPYSNILPEMCAPGTGIRSACAGGGLTTMSGTSMACPHVAGVAALWWEVVRMMPLRARASVVSRKLIESCRADGLTPGLVEAVHGEGIVTAP